MYDRHCWLIVILCGALAACSPEAAYFKRLHAAIDPLIGQKIQVAIAKIGPPSIHAERDDTYTWRFKNGIALQASADVQGLGLDLCTLVLTTDSSNAIINAAISPLPSCEPVLQRLSVSR